MTFFEYFSCLWGWDGFLKPECILILCFTGYRSKDLKLISFDKASLLIFALNSRMARAIKLKFAAIITSYFGGDETLVSEIRANAASNDPIARMARNVLKEGASSGDLPSSASPPVFTQEFNFATDADQVPTASASVYTDEELVKNPPAAVVNMAIDAGAANAWFLKFVDRASTQSLAAKDEVITVVKEKEAQMEEKNKQMEEKNKQIIDAKDKIINAKDETIAAKDNALRVQQDAIMVMKAALEK